MLNRDGVLLEVDGIPAQPNGFAAPQTVECRQHDRRFNQRPLYAGEKLVDFILVIEGRLEAVLARAIYLIRWIHGKLVCLYRKRRTSFDNNSFFYGNIVFCCANISSKIFDMAFSLRA